MSLVSTVTYAAAAGYRIANHGAAIMPPSGAGGVARPFARRTAPVVVWRNGDVPVAVFAVDHGSVRPAVGDRFDYKGRSVVTNGDTAPTPAVAVAAKGAGLLVREALQPAFVARLAGALAESDVANNAQITFDILDCRRSAAAAADAAPLAVFVVPRGCG